MKPTVGHIVHYLPDGDQQETEELTPVPAIITQVTLRDMHRDTGRGVGTSEAEYLVSLRVFGIYSDYRLHGCSYSGVPAEGHWNWPPREDVR